MSNFQCQMSNNWREAPTVWKLPARLNDRQSFGRGNWKLEIK
jgi:hypothetical protein